MISYHPTKLRQKWKFWLLSIRSCQIGSKCDFWASLKRYLSYFIMMIVYLAEQKHSILCFCITNFFCLYTYISHFILNLDNSLTVSVIIITSEILVRERSIGWCKIMRGYRKKPKRNVTIPLVPVGLLHNFSLSFTGTSTRILLPLAERAPWLRSRWIHAARDSTVFY